jgi:hypothetical protein
MIEWINRLIRLIDWIDKIVWLIDMIGLVLFGWIDWLD